MLNIGTQIRGSHGLGQIVGYNGYQANPYVLSNPLDALEIANQAGLLGSVVNSFYGADQYPYIVLFEDGYQDVYTDSELEVV